MATSTAPWRQSPNPLHPDRRAPSLRHANGRAYFLPTNRSGRECVVGLSTRDRTGEHGRYRRVDCGTARHLNDPDAPAHLKDEAARLLRKLYAEAGDIVPGNPCSRRRP